MTKKSQREKNNFAPNIEDFRKKVALDIKAEPGTTLESLEGFLVKWWCRYYNRPYKDPTLLEYTLEELLYEFFDLQLRKDEKLLNEVLGDGELSDEEEAEDEEWLKEMMGKNYMSQNQQEKALGGIREEIEAVGEDKEEGFQHEFDISEFE